MSDAYSMIANHHHLESSHYAKVYLGRHLREEHTWGIRRISRWLGESERWVKEYIDTPWSRRTHLP